MTETHTHHGAALARGFRRDSVRWPLRRSSEVFALSYGRALVEADRRLGDVRVFGTNGQCGWHDVPLFNGPGVILGRKGQGPLGVELCRGPYWVIDTGYSLELLSRDVDLQFAYYLIKYVGLNHLKDGTSNPTLSRDSFGAQLFPIPPLFDQQAIARVAASLDDLIDLHRRTNETLEAMAQALFKSWFIDFDPVRAKADGRQPFGMDAETSALFPDSFDEVAGRPLRDDWTEEDLGVVLAVIETGSRPKGGVRGITAGVPSVGAESITGVGRFDFAKTKYVPDDFFTSMSKGHVRPWDVLLYKDGGRPGEFEPKVTLVGEDFPFTTFCINEHVYRLRADERLSQSFLYLLLDSEPVREEMRQRGTGVAIPGLNSTALRSIPVYLPPPAVVRRFDSVAKPLLTAILRRSRQSRVLSQLRDMLLPKLLSGELRVKDAETAVSAAV